MSAATITSLLRKGWDNLFPIPKVGQTEAFLARAMLAFTLWHFLPHAMDQVTQPVPVGLAHWFDLTWMADAAKFAVFKTAFILVAFWFASGVWLPVSLPILTLLHILPYTLYNSQGHPHHGYQIMSLSLLGMSVSTLVLSLKGRKAEGKSMTIVSVTGLIVAVFAAYRILTWWEAGTIRITLTHALGSVLGAAAEPWIMTYLGLIVFVLLCWVMVSVVERVGGKQQPNTEVNAWLLIMAQFMIAGAYLISVCSKMIRSKGEWLINSHYVALDFVKTMRQSYYSALSPEFAREPAGVVFLMQHENLARLFFDAGVFLEIALIFAVGTRRLAFIFGVCTVAMHISIQELMTLTFFTHESMMTIFYINVPFLVAALVEKFGNKPLTR